jgi:hypothetical protein
MLGLIWHGDDENLLQNGLVKRQSSLGSAFPQVLAHQGPRNRMEIRRIATPELHSELLYLRRIATDGISTPPVSTVRMVKCH